MPFVPKFDNAWRPQAEIFEADPGHTVNGAEVDRFPMEMIEARKVSTCHHRFKGQPSAIRASVSRGRFIPELDSLLLQPNTRPRRSSRRSAGPFARTIKKAMVRAFTSSKRKGRCRKNRALIAENFVQRITAHLGK